MQKYHNYFLFSASSIDPAYGVADTNVVCVKLGIVANSQGSFISAAVPSQCTSCRGINNSMAEVIDGLEELIKFDV